MRRLTLVLEIFLAVAALGGGLGLVIAPDGSLVGLPAAWMQALPFRTYLVPGILLAFVVGGSAAVAAALVLRRAASAAVATLLSGVILLVWIVCQVALVGLRHPLQPICGLGLSLVVLGARGAGPRLYLRWVLANAGGELAGLGVVAAGASLVAGLAAPSILAGALVLLGGLEGAAVGAAQAWALRPALPGLRPGAWVGSTIAGALVAWVLGMLPSALAGGGGAAQLDDRLQLVLAAGLGAVAGPVLAAFQARVLRRHVRGAGLWLPAHAAAWALGMPLIFLAVGLVVDGADLARAFALVAAAGATVGAVHGLVLLGLLRRQHR